MHETGRYCIAVHSPDDCVLGYCHWEVAKLAGDTHVFVFC